MSHIIHKNNRYECTLKTGCTSDWKASYYAQLLAQWDLEFTEDIRNSHLDVYVQCFKLNTSGNLLTPIVLQLQYLTSLTVLYSSLISSQRC